ncbi:hypothetical protein RIF29_22190 [Crotalaria pallida]|uniref:Uncharacterized protein n=1 Tax=Crotalaria pallida TaxID=3830 RepID=A0AAN9F675_CROPI
MEKEAKLLLLTLAIMVVVLASDVEGIRKVKEEKEERVYDKDNFIGGIGGTATFPGPGFTGVGFGPSIFCTYPGGCTSTTTPTLPLTPIAGGVVGSPPHVVGVSPPHA